MPDFKAWAVKIVLRGPVSTASSTPHGMGIDAPFARNAEGNYYIPGTLVKGRLKEALKELNAVTEGRACPKLRELLGKEPLGEDTMDQQRSLLYFGDFIADSQKAATVRYRIQRDDDRGAVTSNMNLMIESPFEPGAEVAFKGRIWTIADGLNEIEAQLQYGLGYATGFGAEVSAGFGQTIEVQVKKANAIEIKGAWKQPVAAGVQLPFALEPWGPVCVGGKRIAGNIFESQTVIPGVVLKGIVAQMLIRFAGASDTRDVESAGPPNGNFAALRKEFARIRFRHAMPVIHSANDSEVKRPVAAPLSLVWTGKELRDAVWLREAFVTNVGRAPAFQPDWKGPARDEAARITGEITPPMELRVRTQIDGEKGRARDEGLFAYRVAAPRARGVDRKTTEYRWLSSADLGAIADEGRRGAAAADLKRLFEEYGLVGLGKLKTHARVHHQPWSPFEAVSPQPVRGNHWIVTLQTPALLVAAGQFRQPASESEMRARLERYWSEASNQSLTLVDYMARHELAGGEYLRHVQKANDYRPYLLMQPGSVFVLRGDHAETTIAEWLERGLPLGSGVKEEFGLTGEPADWKRCPYIRENGFGEIAVNQRLHDRLALQEDEIHAI